MNSDTTSIQHLLRHKALLQVEYNEEKQAFTLQAETVPVERKVKRGNAWWPLRLGGSGYNSLNQLTIEVHRTSGDDIDHHFEPGTPVRFFTCPPSAPVSPMMQMMAEGLAGNAPNGSATPHSKSLWRGRWLTTGTVSYVDGGRMVVALPAGADTAQLLAAGDVGVQVFFDETSYRLMFDALSRAINARGNRLAYLRDLFAGSQPARTFTFGDIHLPWLNSTQTEAVNKVLRAKDVAIVHGPPGTGKTTTLVEAIHETLHRESQVLVCAQSNMAVDWISEKLVDRGVSVLRIGNPTKVNDKMLSFTYERLFADHPDYPQLWSIRKAIRQLRQTPRTKRTRDHHNKMDRLQSRATQLEITIHQQLFSQARVVACTLAGSASRVMQGQKFTTLFIDEAAQALEAACWIAMRRASRVVLAGDHCQLPPTVKSLEAQRGGLGVTLMERLVAKKPEAVTLLRVQYRMNRDIMQFSSDWFYHGRMVADNSVSHRSILDLDRPMQWIDTSADEGHEETLPGDTGRINRHEARHTIEVLKACYQKITPQRAKDEGIDTGLISPYRAQVQLLRQMVRRDAFFKPLAHLITINTVDGFQGQERDIVIVSMVRANGDGRIGFLNDLRRMNVAITRARMKLIIMGNAQTLTRHTFYRKLFEYCNKSED